MKRWLALVPFFSAALAAAQGGSVFLRDGWAIQSSAKVSATGETISSPAFAPTLDGDHWLPVEVPTTVVAAQVKSGVLPDPFYGMNLRQYPGVRYPIGFNFSNVPMPTDSPYGVSWWYRKEFTLPEGFAGKTVWLNFRGINYRANIFLNGKQLANSNDVAGAWRTYDFEVTSAVKPGTNVLAVQVWAPTENSLAITFVDWNPAPPDKNMGLWREVYLTASGPVAVRHPAALSKVTVGGGEGQSTVAHLTVTALLKNASDHAVHGRLKGRIEDIAFEQTVDLAAGESKDVVFLPAQYSQLNVRNPRLWWPVQMGTPNLYDLELSFEVEGVVSDTSQTKFGIREITSEVVEQAQDRFKRLFKINGKKILIRGGGWTPDMMLRETPERLADELRYVRDLGLNTVRLEGKLETEAFW